MYYLFSDENFHFISFSSMSHVYLACFLVTPFARSGHRAVADDNYVWIIGGYNAEFSEHSLPSEQCPLLR